MEGLRVVGRVVVEEGPRPGWTRVRTGGGREVVVPRPLAPGELVIVEDGRGLRLVVAEAVANDAEMAEPRGGESAGFVGSKETERGGTSSLAEKPMLSRPALKGQAATGKPPEWKAKPSSG